MEVKPRLGLPFIPYGVIAALPDLVAPERFGPDGFERNIFDRVSLETPVSLRKRMTKFLSEEEIAWRYPSEQRLKSLRAVENTLARVTKALPISVQVQDVILDADKATRVAFDFHDDQLAVLTELNRHRRTSTLGAAGTGKSVLAVETARKLAAQGYRALFYTPNNLQGSDVIDALGSSGHLYPGNDVPTRPGHAGVHVEYLPDRSRDATAMTAASTRLAETLCRRFDQPMFDALIVDEFQDLTQELEAALTLLLVDEDGSGSEIHLFGDPRQLSLDVGMTGECSG